ncbi:hypothetical protein [Actinoplanes sp. NPDC051411]|uniref:NACHT domain-containing protein n=1 Tax=Actinoplanes sp. NPDC051411 TaxID=3155522 RepID=UPI003413DEF4
MVKPLSYADAASLLRGPAERWADAFGKLTATGMLGSLVEFPDVVGWFDAHAEFARLAREVARHLPRRWQGASGTERLTRLDAAHRVIVIAAYFEVLGEILPAEFGLSREESRTVAAGRSPREGRAASAVLESVLAPVPSDREYIELRAWYAALSERVLAFYEGLAAWEKLAVTDRAAIARAVRDDLPGAAVRRYRGEIIRLTTEFPEVAAWLDQEGRSQTLDRVTVLSPEVALLSRHQRAALDRPVLGGPDVPGGLTLPTLRQAYMEPAFRTDGGDPLAFYLDGAVLRSDLVTYLTGRVVGQPAHRAPLVVLGQPGAGKSMLTRVLAARLAETDELIAVRVSLRDVPFDADVQGHIEHAIRQATGEQVSWPQFLRSTGRRRPVVIFDGLDEMMSAAGHQESDYLMRVAEFQLRELDLGRPVATIVTGRTGVHHRLLIPGGAEELHMQPFTPKQVSAWLTVWNTTNRRYFAEHALEPLSRDVVLRQPELAEQPLLLLMLALYDAQANELTRADERIGGAELYERLMISFAEREARREHPRLAGAALAEQVEHDLGRLSVAALAMLNRGLQSVSEADLDADLVALRVASPIDGGPTPAQETIGGFFFVAENRAWTGPSQLRSFEFLHATFGEYLAARMIAAELHALATETGHTDDLLHALLSFGLVLAEHQEVLAFVRGRLAVDPYDTLVAALRTAHDLRPHDGFTTYRPMVLNVPKRAATYSLNLVLLLTLNRDNLGVRALFPHVADPLGAWERHSSLWHSCLNFHAVVSVLRGRRIRESRDVVIAREDGSPVSVNESIGLHVYPDTELFDHQCEPAPDLTVEAASPAGQQLRAASLLLDAERDGLLDALVPLIRVKGDLSIDRGWDTDLTDARIELEQLLAGKPPAPPVRLVTPPPPPHA